MDYQQMLQYIERNLQEEYFYFYGNMKELFSVPTQIGSLSKARTIFITNSNITSIPKEIGQLQNLEELDLSFNPIESLPAEFAQLKKLRYLNLSNTKLKDFSFLKGLDNLENFKLDNCELSRLPEEINALKHLKTLSLIGNKIKQIPTLGIERSFLSSLELSNNPLEDFSGLTQFQQLHFLALNSCQLRALPPELFQLSELVKLTIANNQLKQIEEKLAQLQKLHSLNISNNPFIEFPAVVGQLTELQELHFDPIWLESFPRALAPLHKLSSLPKSSKNSEAAKSIVLVLKAISKRKYKLAFTEFLLDLLGQRVSSLEKVKKTWIIEAMNSSIPMVISNISDLLSKDYQALELSKKLKKGAVIGIAGKTNFSILPLKDRLDALGIVYKAKISTNTSHLIIAKNSKQVEEQVLENCILLTESDLLEYLNQLDQPYLLAEETTEPLHSENLSAMLLSPQEDTVLVALELLNSGGVPNNLITELLIVYYSGFSPKIRKVARKLIEMYGSSNLVPYLSKTHFALRKIILGNQLSNLVRDLNQYQELFGIEPLTILNFLYSQESLSFFAKGLVIKSIIYYCSKEEAVEIFKSLIKDQVLNLSAFRFRELPESLFDPQVTENVTSLNLSFNEMRKVPLELLKFKKLKKLSFHGNSIRSIPTEIGQLQFLENLDLGNNLLKRVPEGVFALKELNFLSIEENPLEQLDEQLKELPKLSTLRILFGTKLTKEPQFLLEMKQLEVLHIQLGRNTNKEFIQNLRMALPNCNIHV